MTVAQGGAGLDLRRQRLGFAALLLGAAAIGFAPILVRLSDTSPTASAFWRVALAAPVGSSRVDLQACKLEYSIVSPK